MPPTRPPLSRGSALVGALAATAGRAALTRAVPIYLALGLVAVIVLGPNGVKPPEVVHAILRSAPARVATLAAWLVLVVPIVRLAIASPSAFFLRAMPFPVAAFVAIHAVFALLAQAGWFALFCAGAGLLHGCAAAAMAAALAAWIVARPRGAREWALLAALGVVTVVTTHPVLWLASAAPLGARGALVAWRRAPEIDRGARRSAIVGPAPLALALVHLTKLVREDASMLLRSAVLVAVGAMCAVGLVQNAAEGEGASRGGVALAATTLPLAIVASSMATRIVASESRLRWLLDATAMRAPARLLSAVLGGGGMTALFGASAGLAIAGLLPITAGQGIRLVASCTAWALAMSVVALAVASRARARAEPSRVVPPMVVVAFAGMICAGAVGEVVALAGALGAVVASLTSLGLRPDGART